MGFHRDLTKSIPDNFGAYADDPEWAVSRGIFPNEETARADIERNYKSKKYVDPIVEAAEAWFDACQALRNAPLGTPQGGIIKAYRDAKKALRDAVQERQRADGLSE